MSGSLLAPLCFREFQSDGTPAANGTLTSYQAGTSTPLATYTDSTLGTANPNPITLNARGEASVWVPQNVSYKFVTADSLGNQIRSVDNVSAPGLPTLYGGVDTGTANNYILSFAASFSALADGILVWWFASNSNTGASSLSVNGLGTQAIVNPGGGALVAGQILGNQPVLCLYKAGQWVLLLTGTFPLVLPEFTALTAGTTTPDAAGTQWPVGYLGIPQNSIPNGYTAALSDAGKQIYYSGAAEITVTIPANSVVSFPVGTVLSVVNDASAAVNVLLAINSDTLVWTPSGATGTRTIAQYGRAVLLKVGATRWWVSGTGLT